VIRKFTHIGFNIAMVHKHWHFPLKRDISFLQQPVYLDTEHKHGATNQPSTPSYVDKILVTSTSAITKPRPSAAPVNKSLRNRGQKNPQDTSKQSIELNRSPPTDTAARAQAQAHPRLTADEAEQQIGPLNEMFNSDFLKTQSEDDEEFPSVRELLLSWRTTNHPAVQPPNEVTVDAVDVTKTPDSERVKTPLDEDDELAEVEELLKSGWLNHSQAVKTSKDEKGLHRRDSADEAAPAKGSLGRPTGNWETSPFIAPSQEQYRKASKGVYASGHTLNALVIDFAKINHNSSRYNNLVAQIKEYINAVKKDNRIVNMHDPEYTQSENAPTSSVIPKPPLRYPEMGRKQTARIKSAIEKGTSKPKLKPRRLRVKSRKG